MNEKLLNQSDEHQTTRKFETKQDVENVQRELLEKHTKLIEEAPRLFLTIKNAPFCLNVLFNRDGSPKDDFIVPDWCKSKVRLAFKHPNHNINTGVTYWGNLNSREYLIQVTPTFLTDEELLELEIHHRVIKRIDNVDVELVPSRLQRDDYSTKVEKYRERVQKYRTSLQEIIKILSILEVIKAKLPSVPRVVVIEQDDEIGNSSSFQPK